MTELGGPEGRKSAVIQVATPREENNPLLRTTKTDDNADDGPPLRPYARVFWTIGMPLDPVASSGDRLKGKWFHVRAATS